jgi:hypothetical protein
VHSRSSEQSPLAGLVLLVALLSLEGVSAPTAHADAVDTNFLGTSRLFTFRTETVWFPSLRCDPGHRRGGCGSGSLRFTEKFWSLAVVAA